MAPPHPSNACPERPWIPHLELRIHSRRAASGGVGGRGRVRQGSKGPVPGKRLVECRRLGHARRAVELREQTKFHSTLRIKFGLSYARASRDGGPRLGANNGR